jgi:hypothetical protein
MNATLRASVTAGVALVGAGVLAVSPATTPLTDAGMPGIQLAAGDEEITLDFVRHGACCGPIVSSVVPGHELTDTGREQAQHAADILAPQGPYAGIYAGEQIRMPETAAPLAHDLDMDVQTLPGINEINAGIYEGVPIASPGGILYILTVAAWAFGLDLVQMPGSRDINGVAFDQHFSDAVHTMYDDAANSDAVSANGEPADVAFSGQAAISSWTLMNVDNPDISFFLPLFLDQVEGKDFLPDGGIVEVKGDPDDGWTLVSFNGEDVPQDPGLLTNLFVDLRDVITAPQKAAYNIFEAALTGDSTTIADAFQDGLQNIGSALVQFPGSVADDIGDALQNLGTDTGAAASDGTDSPISDALAALI